MKPVKWAPNFYRNLQGVFCVYKPTGMSARNVLETIKGNLTNDLNAMACYRPEMNKALKEHKFILPHAANSKEKSLTLANQDVKEDLTEHRLVLGNRYIKDDFNLSFLHGLGKHSSGVMLVGIGSPGINTLGILSLAKFLRVYHVKGRLGHATDDSYHDGKFVQRTTYRHIKRATMDKICSSTQSGHQKLMFEYAGVHPDSEEAFKLASTGIIRPQTTKTPPLLYSVKCIDFNPPDFTLEIHAINEKCHYLAELIHDIGVRLKSTAVCVHIHRLRYGHFKLEHTILKKDWHVDEIQRNMRVLEPLLRPRKVFTSVRIGQKDNIEDFGDEMGAETIIKTAIKEPLNDRDVSSSLEDNIRDFYDGTETGTETMIKRALKEPMNDKDFSSTHDGNHNFEEDFENKELGTSNVKNQFDWEILKNET